MPILRALFYSFTRYYLCVCICVYVYVVAIYIDDVYCIVSVFLYSFTMILPHILFAALFDSKYIPIARDTVLYA